MNKRQKQVLLASFFLVNLVIGQNCTGSFRPALQANGSLSNASTAIPNTVPNPAPSPSPQPNPSPSPAPAPLPSPGTGNGATLYVAKNGSDANNNCLSSGSPCLTITKGISVMAGGDTLIIGDGTYAESVTNMPNGSASAYTTLRDGREVYKSALKKGLVLKKILFKY